MLPKISSAVSVMVDNVPVLPEQDMFKHNGSEIVGVCMGMIDSTRFWIERKTEYLFSAYKAAVDKQMVEINNYFKELHGEPEE